MIHQRLAGRCLLWAPILITRALQSVQQKPPRGQNDLVTVRTHGYFTVLPHWETRPPAPWLDSIHSHCPWTEPTSPCPNLIMPSVWLGSDKYQFLNLWFRSTRILTHKVQISPDLPAGRPVTEALLIQPSHLVPNIRTRSFSEAILVWVSFFVFVCAEVGIFIGQTITTGTMSAARVWCVDNMANVWYIYIYLHYSKSDSCLASKMTTWTCTSELTNLIKANTDSTNIHWLH